MRNGDGGSGRQRFYTDSSSDSNSNIDSDNNIDSTTGPNNSNSELTGGFQPKTNIQ